LSYSFPINAGKGSGLFVKLIKSVTCERKLFQRSEM